VRAGALEREREQARERASKREREECERKQISEKEPGRAEAAVVARGSFA